MTCLDLFEIEDMATAITRMAGRGAPMLGATAAFGLALAAQADRVPFYAVFPTPSIDLALPNGEAIPVEDRPPVDVLSLAIDGRPVAPPGASARTPTFDTTPHACITALVTEVGLLHPPYGPALSRAFTEGQPA